MHTKEPCECTKMQEELADCRKQRQRNCEEENQKKDEKIVLLEKKISRMTIIGVIAITLLGEAIVDEVMDIFTKVEQVSDKIQAPISGKESDTNVEVSYSNGDFLSDHFFERRRGELGV